MRELRIAIAGCGRMGRERARCAHLLGANVVAVCDPNREAAGAMARSVDALELSTAGEIGAAKPDAVFLCTPPNTRTAYALECIERGIPFLVEKPVGTTSEAVSQISSALALRPVGTAVGYMNRYRRSVEYARQLLRGQQVIGLAGFWVCRTYGVPWWLDEAASGGPHNEQATHMYDLCRWLAGELADVSAFLHSPQDAGGCSVASALQFASGAVGTLLYSCQANQKDIGLRVFTTAGSLFLAGWDLRLAENTITGTCPEFDEPEDAFLTETEAFLSAVSSGDFSGVRCDWVDALRTQDAVDRAARSFRRARKAEGAANV